SLGRRDPEVAAAILVQRVHPDVRQAVGDVVDMCGQPLREGRRRPEQGEQKRREPAHGPHYGTGPGCSRDRPLVVFRAMLSRRRFLAATAAAGAGLLVAPRSVRAADSRIDIRLDEPIGTIAPEIYGHFAEHLGGVVYDGIWVGPGSAIPNVGGIRKALVDHLRRIKAPVIRWPGGCFADSYDWRDGIGNPAERPV